MAAENPWESTETARCYAQFANRHQLYAQASQDLVRLAQLAADSHVVDLACGTGVTTGAVLAVLGEAGRVVAADASQAMLNAARSRVHDGRVRWLRSPAERIDACGIGTVDATVCNAAMWQTDIPQTAAAVSRVLRPGGRWYSTWARRCSPNMPVLPGRLIRSRR